MNRAISSIALFVFCVALLFYVLSKTTPTRSCRVAEIDGPDVLVARAEPKTSSEKRMVIPCGESDIEKLSDVAWSEDAEWFKVRCNDISGWVMADYLICRFSEEDARKLIAQRADEVIRALKHYDVRRFAGYVHPKKGVRLSPYAYVDPEDDVRLTARELVRASESGEKHIWGTYDGRDADIFLTFPDYYRDFIYDHDFENVEQVGYNKFIGKGNTINTAWDVYPNAIIVEYHFPGFDAELAPADWSSLRLVFEELDHQWYVVAIIHDEWTI